MYLKRRWIIECRRNEPLFSTCHVSIIWNVLSTCIGSREDNKNNDFTYNCNFSFFLCFFVMILFWNFDCGFSMVPTLGSTKKPTYSSLNALLVKTFQKKHLKMIHNFVDKLNLSQMLSRSWTKQTSVTNNASITTVHS